MLVEKVQQLPSIKYTDSASIEGQNDFEQIKSNLEDDGGQRSAEKGERELISESSSNIHDEFDHQMQSRILLENRGEIRTNNQLKMFNSYYSQKPNHFMGAKTSDIRRGIDFRSYRR